MSRSDGEPLIHVSRPEDGASLTKTRSDEQRPTKRHADGQPTEQRKFHVSRAMLAQASATPGPTSPGYSKQVRIGPTIFVERTGRKRIIPKSSRQSLVIKDAQSIITQDLEQDTLMSHDQAVEQRHLKRPGVAKRRDPSQEPPARAPLPQSLAHRYTEDMDKITADMNQWVLNEIGANLHAMEVEKKQAEKPKFRPKAPEKRYEERHSETAAPQATSTKDTVDTPMADASEEEGDDEEWVIEEYVRVPAHSMGLDVLPSDVGILVLNGEQESMLFYGSLEDEDEENDEDDEDENGKPPPSKTLIHAKQSLTFFCAQRKTTTRQTIQRTKSIPRTNTIATLTCTAMLMPRTRKSLMTTNMTAMSLSWRAKTTMTMTQEWTASENS